MTMKKISIVIPFLNEKGNLKELYTQIVKALADFDYEIVFVDDGSTDGSYEEISRSTKNDKNVSFIRHRNRQGKGEALSKGVQKAKGSIIVFMDADLQDDPADLPAFLEKIESGADLVNGYRHARKDTAIMKSISSIGNKLLWRYVLKTHLHDMNCGFKAFKKEVLEDFVFYGDNYRFIAYLAEQKGYAVAEVKVNNRERVHGTSKYSAVKLFYGLIDTITTYFIIRFSQKPFHFFGSIGTAILAIGTIIGTVLTWQWYFYGEVLHRRPLLLFAMLLIIVGVQFFLTGIVAELVVYLQHKHEKKYKSS